MCLLTTQKEVKIAKKDITSYKVIQQNMTSLYYNFRWELNKLYETKIAYNPKKDINTVSQAFHSYKSLQDLKYGYFCSSAPCLMVKCTIPKGSEFYSGKQNYVQGYASNKLIINEILDVKEVFNLFDWDNYPFKVGQKIHIDKAETIYQIKNIQPETQYKADLIVENCDTSHCEVIRTVNEKGTWVGHNFELEIFRVNKKE